MGRLTHLEGRNFDLIIIGGGIIGAGIARDAALRGLGVALFEKGDYCSGTTSRSTRLIHGGLRYLETLDFRLVRMDLLERETLLRIAGHLVKPIPFLVPVYNRSWMYRSKLNIGMMLYDLLSFDKTLQSYKKLSRRDLIASEPLLAERGLQGGFLYYDAQAAAPERLVIENIIDAREHGAEAYNYAEVTGALRNGKIIEGVRVHDTVSDTEETIRGRIIINAGGPWADRILSRLGIRGNTRVRKTKGIHFVCPPLSNNALVLFSKVDNRLFFVVPWLGLSLVGTTDTDYSDDPGNVKTEREDLTYLLESIRSFIPTASLEHACYSYAGVRPLVPGEGDPSSISRMHRIDESAEAFGLVSIIGGKITGYRKIAEEVVDLACARLGVRRQCRTAETPLPGCLDPREPTIPTETRTAQHLHTLYGFRAIRVMELARADARLLDPLSPCYPDIGAEVVYSVRNEQCLSAEDFLLRRSIIGFSPDLGRAALPAVITRMAGELNWSDRKMEEEFHNYMELIKLRDPLRLLHPDSLPSL